MQRISVGLIAIATITAGILSPSAAGAAQAIDAACEATGSLMFHPGLTSTAQPDRVDVTGELQPWEAGYPCPLSSPSAPATVAGTLHSDSAYCSGAKVLGDPFVGRLTVTWNDASTSTIRVVLEDDWKSPGYAELKLTGNVKDGLYSGDHLHGRLARDAEYGDCAAGSKLLGWGYQSATPRGKQTPLSFTHS